VHKHKVYVRNLGTSFPVLCSERVQNY